MKNPYKVFHSSHSSLRKKVHIILVEPEQGANVGSVARALANMGIETRLRIVGNERILDESARKLAKHAVTKLGEALFFASLKEALAFEAQPRALTLAATARVGSSSRPHPLWAREAISQAMTKLKESEITEIRLVFGRESDGLTNDEVDLCDWVVTIPSVVQYRSLNLAQATLIFLYEVNLCLLEPWESLQTGRPTQKQRLIRHVVHLAEEVGFVLPGDPFKMKPRLEGIFSKLPAHLPEASTLHGLLDQTLRSVKKGMPDIRGRYRKVMESDGKEV